MVPDDCPRKTWKPVFWVPDLVDECDPPRPLCECCALPLDECGCDWCEECGRCVYVCGWCAAEPLFGADGG